MPLTILRRGVSVAPFRVLFSILTTKPQTKSVVSDVDAGKGFLARASFIISSCSESCIRW